jgi:acyl-CoA thioesterase
MTQERLQRLLTREGRPSAAWEWMGFEILDVAEGRARLAMTCRPEMTNVQGVTHGGFLSTLADSVMGLTMASALPDGERHYSFDLKVTFVSPAEIGDRLVADGRLLHAGRRTGVCEARIEGPGRRLVATSTASFILYLPG